MFLVNWFYGALASLGLWQKEAKEARIMFLGLYFARKTHTRRILKRQIRTERPQRRRKQYSRSEEQYIGNIPFVTRCQIPPTLYSTSEELSSAEVLFLRHSLMPPTPYSTSGELNIGEIKFRAFVLGGHQSTCRILRDYHAKVDAVVYLVNACNRTKVAESREELDAFLLDESLATVPFLILCNNINQPSLMPCTTNRLSADLAEERDSFARYKRLSMEERLDTCCNDLGLTGLTTGKGKVNSGNSHVRPLELFICNIAEKMGYDDGFEWLSQCIK